MLQGSRSTTIDSFCILSLGTTLKCVEEEERIGVVPTSTFRGAAATMETRETMRMVLREKTKLVEAILMVVWGFLRKRLWKGSIVMLECLRNIR
jgi:hypothetical protein